MKKPIFLSLLIGLALMIWLGQWFFGRPSANGVKTVQDRLAHYTMACESCGQFFKASPGQLPALTCPKCGKDTGYLADFAQCLVCKTFFPFRYFRWSPEEKIIAENRLRESSIPDEQWINLMQHRQVRRPDGSWVAAPTETSNVSVLRCSKCGTSEVTKIHTEVMPPPP